MNVAPGTNPWFDASVVRRLAVILVAVAALLGVATPAGAQHGFFFFCNIEPFAYHVEHSSYQGHVGRYEYSATGTTVLTGPDCPFDGRLVTIHERGLVHGVFDFSVIAFGGYDANLDVHHGPGANVHGSVTLFGPAFFGTVAQLVVVETPTFTMTLDQLATIDFTNPHHDPLLSLETFSGSITGFVHVP